MIEVRGDVLSAIEKVDIQALELSDDLLSFIEDVFVPHVVGRDLNRPPNKDSLQSMRDLSSGNDLHVAKNFAEIWAAAKLSQSDFD